ncbi:MAG: hypothetical protein KatS3mg115_0666 [Candidatus Poribacteria bacterium]|nr:MAG: hypothetical protein KatS3mg115_0666 [Candidatus Poribacteria bacterium]
MRSARFLMALLVALSAGVASADQWVFDWEDDAQLDQWQVCG